MSALHREYEFDHHEAKLVDLLRDTLARYHEAREAIATDGPYFSDRFGQLRPHPALGVEKDTRAQAERLIRALRLDGADASGYVAPPRNPSARDQRGR